MKQNTRKWQRVMQKELFTLFQNRENPILYEARRMNSEGDYVRRRFKADCLEDALKRAPIILGLEPERENQIELKLLDAFDLALKNARREKKAERDWNYTVKRFIDWLRENFPLCTHWHLLTRRVIREYLAGLAGKSANTRRLMLQPIVQTCSFLNREYGFENLASGLGIGSKTRNTPKEVYLEDVVGACDFLKKKKHRLEVGVALQGLAGLRLQEATRLTWDKVDLEHGLVEISGITKNEYSNRVIPVCERCLNALRRAFKLRDRSQHGKIREIQQMVVSRLSGTAYGEWWQAYSKEVKATIKQWNTRIDWQTKDLRNALPTFAATEGLLNDLWEQYLGHAPRSVTSRHYIPRLASASQGEKEALERQMGLFRLQVIEPLERAIKNGSSTQIYNIFTTSEE